MKINRGTLVVTSPAFEHGAALPDQYSIRGAGDSPPLEWSGLPDATKSLALVVHDPDAPIVDGFVHWVLSGIPADATGLPENGGTTYRQGVNSRGNIGWTPAAPPPGHGTHHYFFHVFALDEDLPLPSGLTMTELLRRIDPHIINQARIAGTFRIE